MIGSLIYAKSSKIKLLMTIQPDMTEVEMATITVEAVYHKGALRLKKKLDLPEDALVRVDVTPMETSDLKAATQDQSVGHPKASRKHSAFGLWAKYPEAQDPAAFAQTLRQKIEKRQDA